MCGHLIPLILIALTGTEGLTVTLEAWVKSYWHVSLSPRLLGEIKVA